MNITDIDDKIIKRARQLHLFEEYVKIASDKKTVQNDVLLALDDLKKDHEQMDPEKKAMTMKAIEKITSVSRLIESLPLDDLKVNTCILILVLLLFIILTKNYNFS